MLLCLSFVIDSFERERTAGGFPESYYKVQKIQEWLNASYAADISGERLEEEFDGNFETPVTLPVVMKLYAGDAPAAALPAGCAARIMTGAPLPEGADCVLMQELTDSGEETVQLYAAVKPLQNVVFRGEDVAAGAVIAPAGTVLTPAHLGVLAGQGYAEVAVCRPLTVGILSTGSELLEPGAPWAPGKIYDANGIQNAARLRQLGFAVERQQCSDDPEVITGKMQELLTRCDAVITSGGVSVGQKDYLPLVLEKLGAQLLVEGVAQKPGSPMLAAALGGKLVLCLSGNTFAASRGTAARAGQLL